jgi:hypothetical protein
MSTYLKVRIPGKTVLLRDSTEKNGFLSGVEVNKFGDEISSKGFDERLHVIQIEAITSMKTMVMSLKYGELDEV